MSLRLAIACALLSGQLATTATIAHARELEEVFGDLGTPWLSRNARDEPEEPLETDRDSFTPATSTVGPGLVVFESAYSYIQDRETTGTHSFPEIVTRFGLTESLELRLGWNYEIGGGGSISAANTGGQVEEFDMESEADSRMLYGFKYEMAEQEAWVPQSSWIVQASTPTSGAETFTALQIGYVFGWVFENEWRLDSSLRYVATKEEGDHFNDWAPSIVLKIPVAEKWDAHVEYFGIFTAGKAEGRNPQYFSPGLHCLVNPNCEVGVRVGWGLNRDAANSFVNAGVGLRF